MFNNILVYVDPESNDPAALKRAVDAAKRDGAALTIVTVLEPLPKFATLILSETIKDIENVAANDIEEKLERLSASLKKEGVEFETALLHGHTAIEIIRQAIRGNHDLVIKDGDSAEGGDKIHLSHRDMQLLRKCPCTVWLVRAPGGGRIHRVLAAIDPEPGDVVRDELSERIVKMSVALAAEEGAELHILRAWELVGTTIHLAHLSQEELDEYMARVEETYRESLDEFLEPILEEGSQAKVHLLKGTAETAIPEWVEKEQPEVLIMGTVARTGIAGFLIGNTAERVLHQVRCSVIALKPEGFVTPVTLNEDSD